MMSQNLLQGMELEGIINPFFARLKQVYKGHWPTFVCRQKDHTEVSFYLHQWFDLSRRIVAIEKRPRKSELLDMIEKRVVREAELSHYKHIVGGRYEVIRDFQVREAEKSKYVDQMLCALTDLIEQDFYLSGLMVPESLPPVLTSSLSEGLFGSMEELAKPEEPEGITVSKPLVFSDSPKQSGPTEPREVYIAPKPMVLESIVPRPKTEEKVSPPVDAVALVVYTERTEKLQGVPRLTPDATKYLATKAAVGAVVERIERQEEPQEYEKVVNQVLEALGAYVPKEIMLKALKGFQDRVEADEATKEIIPAQLVRALYGEGELPRLYSGKRQGYLPAPSREVASEEYHSVPSTLRKIGENLSQKLGVDAHTASGLMEVVSKMVMGGTTENFKEMFKDYVRQTYDSALDAPISVIPKRAATLSRVFTTIFPKRITLAEEAFYELFKEAESKYQSQQPVMENVPTGIDISSIFERKRQDKTYVKAEALATSLNAVRGHLFESR